MSDRLAVISGTSSGLGTALARELLDRGWEVLGLSRRDPALPGAYRHLRTDLAEIASLAEAIEAELSPLFSDPRWRRIGLVNNAADTGQLGPFERLDPEALIRMYALNTVAPVWLMGVAVRSVPAATTLRIVNVSSGAATHPFPGLAAYSGAKAGLRMSGMVLAAELDSPLRPGEPRPDTAVLSYEPGVVDTAMQVKARSRPEKEFPWVGTFKRFYTDRIVVAPEVSAEPIVRFLESDAASRFTEQRFGG